MEVKPGYKLTEVGVIPEEWETKTLFELAERKKELFDDGDWIESEHITTQGIRLIQTGNIGVGRFTEKETKKYIYEKSFTSLRCKQLRQGDLLVCRLADPAGRACVLPDIGEERIVTSVDVTIFRPPSEMADRVFLSNVFSTPEWFRAVSDRSGGTTHKRISRSALGSIPAPLPPLPEQRAIATALSDVDGLLSGLDRLIAKKRDLKQAAMQQLLTGQTRLPNFDGAWVVRRFSSLIEQVFPKSTLSSGDGLEHGTYPLIVSGGVPKRTEVAQFRDNVALVFSDGGIFAVRYAKGSFSVTDHCYALKLNPALADMRWAEAWFSLHGQQMDRLTFKGSGLRNLDKPSLRNIEIRCPEPVEQAAIADALSNMDAELEALEARRDKTNMLKQGMMQELLTGRIRLVEAEALHA